MSRFAAHFERDKEKVHLRVKVRPARCETNWTHTFTYEACSEPGAGMFIECLETRMGDTLEALRKEAYENGWRDAKAKAAKRSWFSRFWPGVDS